MPIVTTKDGSVHIVEHLENGNIRVDGLEIERLLTEAEARDEVARRAIQRFRAGEFDSIRAATYAVLNEDRELRRIYAGQ